jgi:hypothetical protein
MLVLTTQFPSAQNGNANLAKLHADVVELKQKMADRSDLQAVRRSLLQLEKDMKKVSDNLQSGR